MKRKSSHGQRRDSRTPKEKRVVDLCSPKEGEVLQVFGVAFSKKRIAEALAMKCGTVGKHFESIFRKAGVNSALELMAKCFRDGLLTCLTWGVLAVAG